VLGVQVERLRVEREFQPAKFDGNDPRNQTGTPLMRS